MFKLSNKRVGQLWLEHQQSRTTYKSMHVCTQCNLVVKIIEIAAVAECVGEKCSEPGLFCQRGLKAAAIKFGVNYLEFLLLLKGDEDDRSTKTSSRIRQEERRDQEVP